ncbi:cysteine desulfurase [Streptococcus sobrinus]|uniref:cysteine desulfurase family protein n=1 Tax=Streptococcus sobrinus TaxID=1310 RepID=UPI000BA1A7D3|nr:cysteine desulfurase family protein [Streptococcus sobrinus]OZV23682.1 cysteine desulfurase [Streptococcus sobrinus]
MIYLDNAATTPLTPAVIQSMAAVMSDNFGNPSSIHAYGRKASHLLRDGRLTIAKILGTQPRNLIFTSGATESNNMAIQGYALANQDKGKHLITTAIEHHSVLHVMDYLEKRFGFQVTYLQPDENHQFSPEALKAALREDTILVSTMLANNETGDLLPIAEFVQVLANHQAVFHVDAVQATGKIPVRPEELGVDFLSASAHKFHGPKGVGFLYAKPHHMDNLLHGGEQEEKRRASTENMIGITGMAQAFKEADQLQEENYQKLSQLDEDFLKQLSQKGVDYYLNGGPNRLPHVINIGFPGQNNGLLLTQLDLAGFAVSTGSACTAGTVEPSHVLQAFYGTDSPRLSESIRISLSDLNTSEELSQLATKLKEIIG